MQSASIRVAAITVIAFLAATGGRLSAQVEPPQPRATVDPEARKALDGFGKYVVGLQGFSVVVDVKLQVVQNGNTNAIDFAQKLQAERPNKLSFSVESDAGGGLLLSDGKETAAYINSFGKYLVDETPETWEGIFRSPLATGVISPGNATIVTLALLSSDPAAGLLSTAESVKSGGIVTVDDTKCHLIEATGKELDWKLWLDAGEKPIPRQFVPDLAKTFAKMAKARGGNAALANLQVTNTATYKDWVENPKFAADTFVFTPPEGAVKAESLADIVGGGGRREAGGPHPLLSKAAPAIKLDLLGGGKLDLAALKDKHVVILDFWATWCGPCQQAMPIIEKVAEEYKEKGVLLYAVNIQETPEEVRKFVDESGLHLAIAFDKDGEVAKAYQANAIPQTVIVGKDGTVQVVHVGLSPDLEGQLKKELDALVAGKDLAAEAKAGKTKPPAAAAEADKAE